MATVLFSQNFEPDSSQLRYTITRTFWEFGNFPFSHTHSTLDPPAHRYYAPAALAAGVAAWRAGNDVYEAVRQAGYGWEVAQGLAEYVGSRFYHDADYAAEEPPELVQQSQSQGEEMSAKRQRTSTTTSVGVSKHVKKYVKGCTDRLLERKSYPSGVSALVTPGTAGTIISMLVKDIVQGTGSTNRTGDIIHCKRLRLRINYFDSTPSLMRFILFIDRQSNGTTPTVADVMYTASPMGNVSSKNVVGYGGTRFKIISDRTVVCNPTISTVVETRVFAKDFTKSVAMPITYDGNSTGTAADVLKNNIWLLAISDDVNAGFQWSAVLDYLDN